MANLTPGLCQSCGVSLQSDTAVWCVQCFQKHTFRCPKCRTQAGTVRKEFSTYRDKYGRIIVGETCPVCNGERFVTKSPQPR